MEQIFTREDILAAVDKLAMVPFFPNDSRAAIAMLLTEIVPHKQALDWLVRTITAFCNQWPGSAQLRALLCTRFDAADGIDNPDCIIPGFTPEECYSRHLEQHKHFTADGYLEPESQRMLMQAFKQLEGKPKQ